MLSKIIERKKNTVENGPATSNHGRVHDDTSLTLYAANMARGIGAKRFY